MNIPKFEKKSPKRASRSEIPKTNPLKLRSLLSKKRRKDDVEDKWVVCPSDMTFTREEIMEQVKFQEQYFESEVILDGSEQ